MLDFSKARSLQERNTPHFHSKKGLATFLKNTISVLDVNFVWTSGVV